MSGFERTIDFANDKLWLEYYKTKIFCGQHMSAFQLSFRGNSATEMVSTFYFVAMT